MSLSNSDTSQQRRDETVKKLNDYYANNIGSINIQKLYHEMVQRFPYRLLTLFSYSKNPTPIRKNRYPEIPIETDVSYLIIF